VDDECRTCDVKCEECENAVKNCTVCAANRISAPTCLCPERTFEVEG
jgi:proprotein convertase subtilisin/kexin type 5